jgi:hypothetical protein
VEDKVLSASEPSKCEYEMVMETPSACEDPSLEEEGEDGGRLRDEL